LRHIYILLPCVGTAIPPRRGDTQSPFCYREFLITDRCADRPSQSDCKTATNGRKNATERNNRKRLLPGPQSTDRCADRVQNTERRHSLLIDFVEGGWAIKESKFMIKGTFIC